MTNTDCQHPDRKVFTGYFGKSKAEFCLHCGARTSNYTPAYEA